MAAPTVYEIPQGQCIFQIGDNQDGTLEVWSEIPFKTLTYTDDSTTVDVTTTKHRAGTGPGIQWMSDLATAQGITVEIEALRITTGGATPALDTGMGLLWAAWKAGGASRIRHFRLQLPEDNDGTDYIAFSGNIQSVQPLGGSVTDAASFRVRIKSYGTVAETVAP
jgi:hypothetical protein